MCIVHLLFPCVLCIFKLVFLTDLRSTLNSSDVVFFEKGVGGFDELVGFHSDELAG